MTQEFAALVLCVACGETERIYVNPMDYRRWVSGTHVQDAFPYLTIDERESLITNMCLDCIDEMYRDAREDEDYISGELYDSFLDPESDWPNYQDDYYVDQDCD